MVPRKHVVAMVALSKSGRSDKLRCDAARNNRKVGRANAQQTDSSAPNQMCLPTVQPVSPNRSSPLARGRSSSADPMESFQRFKKTEQRDHAHDLDNLAFGPMRAQGGVVGIGHGIGHLGCRMGKGQCGFLGIGKMRAVCKVPHIV